MTISPGLYYRSATITTAQAFDQFRRELVDLDPNKVGKARRSRDYLQEQIVKIAEDDPDFPRVTGQYLPYGSFARSTKVRPLDDLDMLVMLNEKDSQEERDLYDPYTFKVRITANSSPLKPYVDETGYVSSTKILNRMKSGLQKVPNYRKSEIKRTGVAVVLNLVSYPWIFDIVPSLAVKDYYGAVTYYLIPNGKGEWMRTDPRKDQELVSVANQNQNGRLLSLIRLIKYWNMTSYGVPRLMSYHLETLLISGFHYGYPAIASNIRSSVPDAFYKLASLLTSSCPDPKQLGPNLDTYLDWEQKEKVRAAAITRAEYAEYALDHEKKGEHKEAIKWWGYVFANFPKGDCSNERC